jgi:AcrR family transcriptional regulator
MNTRANIIDEAFAEFLARGYKRADVISIAQRAGVTKGGLYYYFNSKSDLAYGVLESMATQIDSHPIGLSADTLNVDVRSLLPRVRRGSRSREDMEIVAVLIKLSSEVPRTQKAVHQRIEKISIGVVDRLSSAIRQAQAQKQLASSVKSRDLSLLVCAVALGSIALSGILSSRAPVERVYATLDRILGVQHGER